MKKNLIQMYRFMDEFLIIRPYLVSLVYLVYFVYSVDLAHLVKN